MTEQERRIIRRNELIDFSREQLIEHLLGQEQLVLTLFNCLNISCDQNKRAEDQIEQIIKPSLN